MSKLSAAAIIGGNNTNRKRQINDFYPTPPEVTNSLLNHIDISNENIWEPCAGDGAMVDVIKKYTSKNIYASDLSPQRNDIHTFDFLSGIPSQIDTSYMIITNPPFKISAQIIEKSFEHGFTKLALLLKSTYYHASSRTELFEKYRPTKILPLNWRPDFLGLGSPTMEVSWFYWDKPCSNTTCYDILSKK